MQIDKTQILELLQSLGKQEQARHASRQLPDTVDTDNPEHQNLLSKLGIDLDQLGGLGGLSNELGGLGKLL